MLQSRRQGIGRSRPSPQLELFPELAPEIAAVLTSERFRPQDYADDHYIETNVPIDHDIVFQRPRAGELTDEQRQAFAGVPITRPEDRVAHRAYGLNDPEAPGPIDVMERVGGGEGFSVSTATAGGEPALVINWSTMDFLLDDDDRVGGGAVLVFASSDERDEHLEELWRRGEA